jgi:L-fuculose-phosphate aldolase
MSKWLEHKKEVLAVARRALEYGLVVGTSGNVSRRLPTEEGSGLLAITPSSRYYDQLKPNDIQVVNFETEPIEGDLPPSVETKLHIRVYRTRKDTNAIIHTHSTFASAIAVAGLDIPAIEEDQVAFLGGEIKLAKYTPSASDQVESIIAALGNRNAALLASHGALGLGRTLKEALITCQLIEKTAKMYYLALSMGKVTPLPSHVIETKQAFFETLKGGNE